MVIKLLTSFASLAGSWLTGETLTVGEQISKETAESLLKANLAQVVLEEQPKTMKSPTKPKTTKSSKQA